MLYNKTTDKFVYKMQQLQLKISSSEMLLCCTIRQQTSLYTQDATTAVEDI